MVKALTFLFILEKSKVMILTLLFERLKERLCMGSYLTRFWQPDGHGMNKAERMGGMYHPYSPDTIADHETMLSPSCADAVARAQEALGRLDVGGNVPRHRTARLSRARHRQGPIHSESRVIQVRGRLCSFCFHEWLGRVLRQRADALL